MLENEKQRRWWFANHPEYSNNRKGRRKHANGEGHDDQETVSPESVDAYVDEAHKYLDGPEAALLKSFKRNFGTQASGNRAASDSPAGASSQDSDLNPAVVNSPSSSGPSTSSFTRVHKTPTQTTGGLSEYPKIGKMVFETESLTVYDNKGNVVAAFAASSGQPGVRNRGLPYRGPIPRGTYTLKPSQVSEAGYMRRFFDAVGDGNWGQYRVRLYPEAGTNTFGRTNLFLHGGWRPGSAGCINVGNKDKVLFPWIMNQEGPIRVEVK